MAGRAPGARRCSTSHPPLFTSGVPVILGSRNEVERIERYHRELDNGTDRPYVSPLFNERSLFRPDAHN